MVTIDEGKQITKEIATMLNGMNNEQKLRVRDMIAVASVLSAKQNPEEQQTA